MKIKVTCFLFTLIFLQPVLYAQSTDIDLLRKINVDRNPKLDNTFLVVTHSDTPISIGIPAIMLTVGLIKKDSVLKQNALMITGSLVASSIISVALKYGINRDRPFITYPEIVKLAPGGSPAFPSGHTSMAFSTATSLSIAYPKWYIITPSFLWAGAVGYSRMHLGVHYPSDVLVGALIGSGSAWLSSFLTKKIQLSRTEKRLLL
jgi:membrane-associated phospholipid phosphatase